MTERNRISEMQVRHQRLPAGGKSGTVHEQRRKKSSRRRKRAFGALQPEITRNFPRVEQIIYRSLKRGRMCTGECEVSQ